MWWSPPGGLIRRSPPSLSPKKISPPTRCLPKIPPSLRRFPQLSKIPHSSRRFPPPLLATTRWLTERLCQGLNWSPLANSATFHIMPTPPTTVNRILDKLRQAYSVDECWCNFKNIKNTISVKNIFFFACVCARIPWARSKWSGRRNCKRYHWYCCTCFSTCFFQTRNTDYNIKSLKFDFFSSVFPYFKLC